MSSITPVIWEARTAHDISAVFNIGDHAVSSGIAGQTWTATAETWAGEIAGHLASAMAKLGVGMEGINGAGALVRLTGFAAWVADVAVQSGLIAAAHDIHTAAYTAATITMPSLPEIAAVDTACAAGGTLGAATGLGPEAAAGAQKAMDLQAALTMDAYELANVVTMLAPVVFPPPPGIANAGGAIDAFLGAAGNPITDAIGNAVRGAAGVGQTIQSVAGQVQAVAPALTSAGAQAISAATDIGSQALGGSHGAGLLGTASVPAALGTLGAGGVAGTLGAVTFGDTALPDGWGGGTAGAPIGGAGLGPNTAAADAERPAVRPASNSAALGQQRRPAEDDEAQHDTPDYLKNFEHFADGRTIGPAVIGVFTEAEPGR